MKSSSEENGKTFERTVTINPEDIIALFAGLIALSFGVSMIVGLVSINEWTIGVISLWVRPGVAKVVGADPPRNSR